MTTVALNNLWSYLQGLSLSQKDRQWLASKLVEPVDHTKTAQQQAYVKETLTRALDEYDDARRTGRRLQSLDDFLKELKQETSE